jgi:hypothetical protein
MENDFTEFLSSIYTFRSSKDYFKYSHICKEKGNKTITYLIVKSGREWSHFTYYTRAVKKVPLDLFYDIAWQYIRLICQQIGNTPLPIPTYEKIKLRY